MAVKIRLQRHGRKSYAYFHIVTADARSKRDGRFIEKLGTYNPNTNPASIDIDFDRALYWVKKGAQPSDTARAILKYKGVIHKDHLDRGVLKGALTQEQADAKFEKWLAGKDKAIQGKIDKLEKAANAEATARMKAETEVKEAKAAEVLKKTSEIAAAEAAAAKAEEAPAEEAKAEEAPAEEAKAEEAPAEEVKAEEAPAEEVKAEEAPAEEVKAEEAPAAEEKKAE